MLYLCVCALRQAHELFVCIDLPLRPFTKRYRFLKIFNVFSLLLLPNVVGNVLALDVLAVNLDSIRVCCNTQDRG